MGVTSSTASNLHLAESRDNGSSPQRTTRDRSYQTILLSDRSSMHSMRTYSSVQRSWFHRESADPDHIRQSLGEQTELLSNPLEDSDMVTDPTIFTTSSSQVTSDATCVIEKQDQVHSVIVEPFPAISSGQFLPQSLVGCEIEITDVGFGTVSHYLYEENEAFYYLFQMRDGRKVVVPISITHADSSDFRIQGKIIGRLF